MSDYVKTTNFTAKDALATGDPDKLITGALFDTEFDDIATASATKQDASDKGAAGGFAGLDGAGKVNDAEMPTASETVRGPVEIATQTEVDAGTDDVRMVTSKKLAAAKSLLQATETQKGAAELATQTETNTGTDDTRIVTPLKLATATSLLQATAIQKGAASLATQAEADAGSVTNKIITPETLKAYAGGFASSPGAGARGALAFGTSNQATVTSVELTVLFDTEAYDTDAIHSTSSNTSRLTVPSGVTKIRLTAQIQFAGNSTGIVRKLRITKNGGGGGIDANRDTFLPVNNNSPGGNLTAHMVQIVTGVIECVATDYFEMKVEQNSGGALNLLADMYWFEMEILA